MLVFGHGGAPVLVFPTSLNRFFEWEDRGMISALSAQLINGHNRLYCVDSLDRENIYNRALSAQDRFAAYDRYQRYIFDEVMPFIYDRRPGETVMAAGASFGAYHAVNCAFRHPVFFTKVIALGGNYSIRNFTDGVYDHQIYLNNPIDFMANVSDSYTLEQLRKIDIRLVTGENDMCREPSRQFSEVLHRTGVPHTFDLWGGGTGHDWQYWHEMIKKHIV